MLPRSYLEDRMEDRRWVIITLDDEGHIQEVFMDSWMQVLVVSRSEDSLFLHSEDNPEARSV